LIVADVDGIPVAPFARIDTMRTAVRTLQEGEEATIAKIVVGTSLKDIYCVPEISICTPNKQD
jgi:hypothetical protein